MAVSGNPLTTFTDLMESTPQSYASGINEFAAYLPERTWLLNAMFANSAMDQRFFKGVEITDLFIDDVQQTGAYRNPNGEFSFSLINNWKRWKSYPSLFLDYVAWTQWELEQNGIVRDLRGPALRERFKDLRDKKFKLQLIGQARQFENDLLATPDYDEMEGPDAFRPRSIPCYINEGLNSDWTTIQGIDHTVVTEFGCTTVQADYSSGIGTPAWAGFTGLDILCSNVEFDPIPFAMMEQTPKGPARYEFLLSSWGFALMQQQIRSSNDHLRLAGNDPAVPGPQFNGIRLRRLTTLNERPIWSSGSGVYTGGTEKTATGGDPAAPVVAGPRVILMDYAAIQPRFHSMFNFYRHSVREHPRVVGTQVMPIETWWTVLSMDPRTCGVMSPRGSALTPPNGV